MHALYVNEREECEGFGEWLQQQQKCNSDRGDSISKKNITQVNVFFKKPSHKVKFPFKKCTFTHITQ